jgi:Putative endonuclease segE, GIY-YIG domain
MTWIYEQTPLDAIPENAQGFVYCITNNTTGRRYIGKKTFWSVQSKLKSVTLKTTGVKKKKKVRTKKESDWRTYYGSSEDVKHDVEALGTEVFSREILRICYSKGEMTYYEAKYQFELDVLIKPSEFYNNWISARVQRAHLKHLISSDQSVTITVPTEGET